MGRVLTTNDVREVPGPTGLMDKIHAYLVGLADASVWYHLETKMPWCRYCDSFHCRHVKVVERYRARRKGDRVIETKTLYARR